MNAKDIHKLVPEEFSTYSVAQLREELWTHIVCHHMEYDHTISM